MSWARQVSRSSSWAGSTLYRWMRTAVMMIPFGLPGRAGGLAGGGVDPVEGVGGGDPDHQGGELLVVVVLGRGLPDAVRHRVRSVGQPGGVLGQGQGGAFGF